MDLARDETPRSREIEEERVVQPETENAERVERGEYDTGDDPGGSADREALGRDREHIEEQSPDDFDEVDEEEVSHG